MNQSQGSLSNINIGNVEQIAMNIVHLFCGIICLPVEFILRPSFGTQYVPAPVFFFSSLMMLFLPLVFSLAEAAAHMIPFASFHGPVGLVGFGTLSKYFFIGGLIHGARIWHRMLHMETETNSRFEGPALPIFRIFPKATFWTIRILWEPVTVFLLATMLAKMLILQGPPAAYLQFAAFCLAMKNFVDWVSGWKFLRDHMDARALGPIIAKLVQNGGTAEEMATARLGSFPANLPPEIRNAATSHFARQFSTETPSAPTQGGTA